MIVDTPTPPTNVDANDWEEVSPGMPDEQAFGHITRELSSGLYSDPVGSLVRETVSNAIDSHARRYGRDESGRVQGPPVNVTIKSGSIFSEEGSVFIVEDSGVGLSHKHVLKRFAAYGASGKRDTNNELGAKGIGAKSPFAYQDNIVVESFHEGLHNLYYWQKSFPQNRLRMPFRDKETDRTNGLVVRVPIKPGDEELFRKAVQNELVYYQYALDVVGAEFDRNPVQLNDTPLHVINKTSAASRDVDEFHVVMDGAVYPVPCEAIIDETEEYLTKEDMAELDTEYGTDLYEGETFSPSWSKTRHIARRVGMRMPIGSLDVTASREELRMTDSTKKQLLIAVLETGQIIWNLFKDIADLYQDPATDLPIYHSDVDINKQETAETYVKARKAFQWLQSITDNLPEGWDSVVSEDIDFSAIVKTIGKTWFSRFVGQVVDNDSPENNLKPWFQDGRIVPGKVATKIARNHRNASGITVNKKVYLGNSDLFSGDRLYYTDNYNVSRKRAAANMQQGHIAVYKVVHLHRLSDRERALVEMLGQDHKDVKTRKQKQRASSFSSKSQNKKKNKRRDDDTIPITIFNGTGTASNERIAVDWLEETDRNVHLIYGHQDDRSQLNDVAKLLRDLNSLETAPHAMKAPDRAKRHKKMYMGELHNKPHMQYVVSKEFFSAARDAEFIAPGHTYAVVLISKANAKKMHAGSFSLSEREETVERSRTYAEVDEKLQPEEFYGDYTADTYTRVAYEAVPTGDFALSTDASSLLPEHIRASLGAAVWPTEVENGTFKDYLEWIRARLIGTKVVGSDHIPDMAYGYMADIANRLDSIYSPVYVHAKADGVSAWDTPQHYSEQIFPIHEKRSHPFSAWKEAVLGADIPYLGVSQEEVELLLDYIEETRHYEAFDSSTRNWTYGVRNGRINSRVRFPAVQNSYSSDDMDFSVLESFADAVQPAAEKYDQLYKRLPEDVRSFPLGVQSNLSVNAPRFSSMHKSTPQPDQS